MTATNSKSAMVLANNELNVTILDILNIIVFNPIQNKNLLQIIVAS